MYVIVECRDNVPQSASKAKTFKDAVNTVVEQAVQCGAAGYSDASRLEFRTRIQEDQSYTDGDVSVTILKLR